MTGKGLYSIIYHLKTMEQLRKLAIKDRLVTEEVIESLDDEAICDSILSKYRLVTCTENELIFVPKKFANTIRFIDR